MTKKKKIIRVARKIRRVLKEAGVKITLPQSVSLTKAFVWGIIPSPEKIGEECFHALYNVQINGVGWDYRPTPLCVKIEKIVEEERIK